MQFAFAVGDIANPVYVEMMQAVDGVTQSAGYRLVLHSTGSDPEREIAIVAGLSHRYADGLILSPLRITPRLLRALREAPVPVVIIGSLPESEPLDCVRADSRRGAGLAIEHLAALGRRRIAFVNGDPETIPAQARLDGYRAALSAAGLRPDKNLVAVGGAFSYAAGRTATRALFAQVRPDALFCADDLLAIGAMRALADLRLRIPDDVAVVGMDDTELAQMSSPALSSVSLGSTERARLAATLLLDRLAEPRRAPRHLTFPPQLVVRESSGGAPAVAA
jgi:LacI family transcriptional regulator, galactose operon repressor